MYGWVVTEACVWATFASYRANLVKCLLTISVV